MKKMFLILFSLCFLLSVTACGRQEKGQEEPDSATGVQESDNPETESSEAEKPKEDDVLQEDAEQVRVRLTFDGGEAIVRLEDNAAARDFLLRLPMTQTFEDFNSIEKICRLPEEIATDGIEAGVDPDIADVTLYAPWNTLVFYYEDYGYNDDLIPMGHVESGIEFLAGMGDGFTVTMEWVEETASMYEGDQDGITEITMSVGDTVITAELSDSETTRAFLETLPRTLTMNRYGNREYYGRIEEITENGEEIPDFENGDVTYYPTGPSFAVFFGGEESSDQGGLIRMGRVTSDLSVFDTLGESAEVLIEIAE